MEFFLFLDLICAHSKINTYMQFAEVLKQQEN